MQNHRRNIQKRAYREGDIVGIPVVQLKIKTSILPGVERNRKIYEEVKVPFRINLIKEDGTWIGEFI